MQIVLDSAAMKAADEYTQMHYIPGAVLMDRAAGAVYTQAKKLCGSSGRILVVCGKGNNGGDGFVTAELLLRDYPQTEVFFVGEKEDLTAQNRELFNRFLAYGGRRAAEDVIFSEYNLIIDALFGIGLSRTVTGIYAQIIEKMNRSGVTVLSVDLPSGIHTDTGAVMGCAVHASVTVTFAYLKPGLLLYPGAQYSGETVTADIGIREDLCPALLRGDGFQYFTHNPEDIGRILPERKRRSHKGTYGHALIAAGSGQTGGCAVLAAEAAYRTGAGLVTCLSDSVNRPAVLQAVPEALFLDRTTLFEGRKYTAAAAGPGIGVSDRNSAVLLETLLCSYEGPLVLDADALTILAENEKLWNSLTERTAPTVLTPHPGEMSRLCGRSAQDILNDTVMHAAALAVRTGAIVLLKDAATVVTDGKRVYINQSGCDGMATGGSGDVLTGILGGLLAQGMPVFEAVCGGTFLHGLAGEKACAQKGARGMLAGDMVRALPGVLQSCEGSDIDEPSAW